MTEELVLMSSDIAIMKFNKETNDGASLHVIDGGLNQVDSDKNLEYMLEGQWKLEGWERNPHSKNLKIKLRRMTD